MALAGPAFYDDDAVFKTYMARRQRDEPNIAVIADILAANIRGAQKVVIPETAHLPNMEKPDVFNQLVLEFLQRAHT